MTETPTTIKILSHTFPTSRVLRRGNKLALADLTQLEPPCLSRIASNGFISPSDSLRAPAFKAITLLTAPNRLFLTLRFDVIVAREKGSCACARDHILLRTSEITGYTPSLRKMALIQTTLPTTQ